MLSKARAETFQEVKTMTKIELAKNAYDLERAQGHHLNTTFKQYFDFMWKNEKKERIENYIAYLSSK